MKSRKSRIRISVKVEEDGFWKESVFEMEHPTFVMDTEPCKDLDTIKVIISGVARKVLRYKWPVGDT